MRFLFVFGFVTVLLAVALAKNEPGHNLLLGQRTHKDQHLLRQVVYKKSSFLRKVSGDYVFQQKNVPSPKIITQVIVTDQYTNGNGGYATLTTGGPGMNYVELHFRSQRGRGYNFVIDIYGE